MRDMIIAIAIEPMMAARGDVGAVDRVLFSYLMLRNCVMAVMNTVRSVAQ